MPVIPVFLDDQSFAALARCAAATGRSPEDLASAAICDAARHADPGEPSKRPCPPSPPPPPPSTSWRKPRTPEDGLRPSTPEDGPPVTTRQDPAR